MTGLAEIVFYHLRHNGDIYLAHWVVWTYVVIIALWVLGIWFRITK